MSPSDDRVAVPTNGHRPKMADQEAMDTAARTDLEAERGAVAPSTVSPAQLAAGFGIIAAVILLLLGRRRARRD